MTINSNRELSRRIGRFCKDVRYYRQEEKHSKKHLVSDPENPRLQLRVLRADRALESLLGVRESLLSDIENWKELSIRKVNTCTDDMKRRIEVL